MQGQAFLELQLSYLTENPKQTPNPQILAMHHTLPLVHPAVKECPGIWAGHSWVAGHATSPISPFCYWPALAVMIENILMNLIKCFLSGMESINFQLFYCLLEWWGFFNKYFLLKEHLYQL